jgi:hypothetical protein
LEDLKILDFSGNEDLEGATVPPAFGPRRHEIAVFVDNEPDSNGGGGHGSDGEEEHGLDENGNPNTNDNDDEDEGNDYEEEGEEEDDEYYDDEDDENVKFTRDLMEDVALESLRFFRRLEYLEDFEDLESQFKRLLASKDTEFIKYLLRRYSKHANNGDDEDEDNSDDELDQGSKIAARRDKKDQIDYARKEKERYNKTEKAFGRKMKDGMKFAGDY